MENAANRLLFESIIRTLHSQSFSRTSNQSCTVLADLLTRYLRLLASTCAGHASHSGRTELNAQDVAASLEELGVTIGELKQFQEVEGRDLARYAYISQRRRQDLHEMKCTFQVISDLIALLTA
jgi:histone H3/H4